MASNNILSHVEKLKGRENYNTWQFAIRIYLEHEELQAYLEDTGTDKAKESKAKTSLILSIDPSIYVHIQEAKTAKAVWETLKSIFDDSGLCRKVSLLRLMITTSLDNCKSMEEYVNTIIGTAHKLNGVGMIVNEEWIGAFLLAGLSEEYKPMIMAIENSGMNISGDAIKTKLLQEVKSDGAQSAFYGKGSSQRNKYNRKNDEKRNVRCYTCNEPNHISRFCPTKIKCDASNTSESSSKDSSAPAFNVVFSTGHFDRQDWYVDSGASHHMTSNFDWLTNVKKSYIREITVADDTKVSVRGSGNLKLESYCQGKSQIIDVNDVLCVPHLTTNLLSVSQIIKHGNKVIFGKDGCSIYDANKNLLATASLIHNVYRLNTTQTLLLFSAMVWHRRMGHLNYGDLKKLRDGTADGIHVSDEMKTTETCVDCLKGKQSRFSFNNIGSRANSMLDVIHSDICGPMETTSIGGAKYYVTFIDDYTRKVFVYFLKAKSECCRVFQDFKAMVENQVDKKIKVLRTDNGGEYTGNQIEDYLRSSGVQHQTTASYTPQQNGLSERMNRTIVERARSMLSDARLGKEFWAEAVNTAVYLINRSPASGVNKKTPEELWTHKKPDLQNLRIFGCKAMVHVPKERRQKWDEKSKEMIFVGYCNDTKAYRVIDPDTHKICKSRDVVFIENDKLNPSSNDELKEMIPGVVHDVIKEIEPQLTDNNLSVNVNMVDEVSLDSANLESSSSEYDSFESESEHDDEKIDANFEIMNIKKSETSPIRKSSRIPKPRVFADSVLYSATSIGELPCEEPLTVDEAKSSIYWSKWKDAMDEEMNSLKENFTWTLIELPAGRKPIKNKWVFKEKKDESGKTCRFKARLVVKGCSQRKGVDYNETYSPVVRYTSIRYLIAKAVELNLMIDQMDAVTAFLQSELDEEIFMMQPDGFDDGTKKVCKLNKAIYGLKQASRTWNNKLNQVMVESGYRRSKLDPCVYIKNEEKALVIVAIYVDDMLIFYNDEDLKNELKFILTKNFKMKDLGRATSCVGLRITRDATSGKIFLDQENYIHHILSRFNMTNCNPISTPSDINQKLTKQMSPKADHGNSQMQSVPYQEAVGSLLYLVQGTRPDLTFAVNNVSRFNNNPGKPHWEAVKRILRYLKGTSSLKLEYSKNDKSRIVGYSDADWGGDQDDRRSCTGYVFTFSGGAISWASKRQATVALSSAEAEYMAMSCATQEALWLKQMEEDLWAKLKDDPVVIFCDSQSALCLSRNDGYNPRTKHIDIRYHFIRQNITQANVCFEYVGTKQMVADTLTKAVAADKFKFCTSSMGLLNYREIL